MLHSRVLHHRAILQCSSGESGLQHRSVLITDHQRLTTYYMINYYIKYVELIDTVFLVLKKKPLGECSCFFLSAVHVPPVEKASCTSRADCSVPTRVPPRCYRRFVLHPARRKDLSRKCMLTKAVLFLARDTISTQHLNVR